MEIKKLKFLTLYIPRANLAFGKRGFTSSNPPTKSDTSDISFYAFATGQIRKVVTIERPVNNHIGVSPDGRTILYPQSDESGSVLMLVENFR